MGTLSLVPLRHHTKDKGDIAAARVHADLIERGATVLLPLTEHAPFDVVAYLDQCFYRIQVKYRATSRGVLPVHFRSVWSDRNGLHQRPIDRDEIDIVAIYSPETKLCYYLRPQDFGATVSLRLSPPKNSQNARILLADDFREMPPKRRDTVRTSTD